MSPRKKKDKLGEESVTGNAVDSDISSPGVSDEIVVVARGRTVPLPSDEGIDDVVEMAPAEDEAGEREGVDAEVLESDLPAVNQEIADLDPIVTAPGSPGDFADQEVSGSEGEDSTPTEDLNQENNDPTAQTNGVDESSVGETLSDAGSSNSVDDVTTAEEEIEPSLGDSPEEATEDITKGGPEDGPTGGMGLIESDADPTEDSAIPAGEQDQPVRQLQQIDTPLGKFKKWLGGTTTVGRPLAQAQPTQFQDPPEQAPPAAEQVMTLQMAKKELRTLKASQRSWDSLIADREEKSAKTSETIEDNERKVSALSDWVTNFDRSYQWRVQQRMDQQLQRAEADLRAYEESVKNVEEFEVGRLSELRRAFHRLVRQIFAVTLPIAILTIAIPISFRIPKLDALETFYDPRLSAPIIALLVLGVIAGIFLFRRATGKDTVKNLTIVKWVLLTIAVGVIIVALPVFEDDMRNVLSPYLEENQNRILTVLGIIVSLWIVLALAVYYRGWSQYRRAIDTQLAKLQAVISGYVETQQEVNRLGVLYKQTSEWLRIMAFSLYRPWVTPGEWEEEKHTESEFKDFPFALRVAQVDDQAGAKSAELERIIASKLLVKGWRARAFRDLVHEVSNDMGVASGKFTVEALDKDLPHQTNNTRNLLTNYLEAAAKDVDGTNTGDDASTAFLVEVARKRLLELIEQTQSVALSAARPPVNQIISDPLEELVNDSALLHGTEESENWDSFLKESLGTDDIIQPPLSILNFTPDGQMNKVGESPKSFVLIPQRLAEALPGGVSESVNLVPLTDNSSRAVEIIARVDVVGPIKPGDIRLLSPNVQRVSAMSHEQRDSGAKIASLCQDCFDSTCPASLDPRASCSSGGL